MKLPNAERADVDIAKLRDYCLNPNHPKGKHKARVFAVAFGFTREDAETLRGIILGAAGQYEVTQGIKDAHGQRFILDLPAEGLFGQVSLRTAWIVDTGKEVPRLLSCYVRNR